MGRDIVAKIFIGGTVQAIPLARDVQAWLAADHDVTCWDSPELWGGDYTLEHLQEAAEKFDAGVFVFSEDDRAFEERESGRDKALAEFGLFVGTHGKRRALICHGGSRPNHLVGMTYIDISSEQKSTGKRRLERWAMELGSQLKPKVIRHGGESAEIIPRFPLESYKIKLQRAQLATVLDLYLAHTYHFDLIQAALQEMLENQGSAQILLCDPESPACALRDASLPSTNVKAEVQRSLKQLEELNQQLSPQARSRLEVGLYNTLPALSSYRVDDLVIGGCHFHGMLVKEGPQFSAATTRSVLGEQLVLEHERVWNHPQTRKLSL